MGNQTNAESKKLYMSQRIRKKMMEPSGRTIENKAAMEALVLDFLRESWLKVFYDVKYEFRSYCLDGTFLRTPEGKMNPALSAKVSKWTELAYAVQQQKQTPNILELHASAKKLLFEAMKARIFGRRFKLLLTMYLTNQEIPLDCLSDENKLETMLLEAMYEEFIFEVKHSSPVTLPESFGQG